MGGSELTLNVVASGKPLTLTLAANSLLVKRINQTNEVPIRQVLQAQYTQDSKSLQISYIARRKPKAPFALVRLEGTIQGESSLASDFAERVTNAAYNEIGVPRERRLKVIVNPHGGVRDGVAAFMKKVEPVFRAACCVLDVQHTTHSGHAYEIAKDLSLDYDAVVSVSGDGVIHEILNGFAHHQHPTKVFAIPIAPIPTGSGNGLSLNLLGLADGFDVVYAALNVVKGLPMKIDLFSFVQKGKRTISFMSQSMGLMAELDIGTDNLRWMGDTRFMVGLLRGLIPFKPCPVELSYKVASQDKIVMAEECCQRQKDDRMRAVPTVQEVSDDPFPDLQVDCDSGEWTKFEEPLLYVYCGKGPYVGRDFMAFPASLPDDGLIDIVAQVASSRTEVITEISAGAKGGHFWKNSCHYIKAHAYKVKPLVPKGALSVDGESFPFEPFHVEVHRELGTVLTPHGHYAAEFPPKPL